MRMIALLSGLMAASAPGCAQQTTHEIAFESGPFHIVGDLILPPGQGPHSVILFVHGDGPNSRTSGVTYPPIMERMHRAGFATFAWDKPGTGESTGEIDRSRLTTERSQIVLDAIATLERRREIDMTNVGLWGISQAGYVIPRVLERSDHITFVIAVSCPGEAGVEQGAFLLSSQAVCAGLPLEDRGRVEDLISAASWARTYEEYMHYKEQQAAYPALGTMAALRFRLEPLPRERWHADDPDGEYFFDPMAIIEQTSIPILAFFGERDTQADPIQGAQAYRRALIRAGHPASRVALIPGTDHNIIVSETGCMEERDRRSRSGWQDYAPQYLDMLEAWLRQRR
jgi:pimeloyl-ACP methyl ester carboxylesterase